MIESAKKLLAKSGLMALALAVLMAIAGCKSSHFNNVSELTKPPAPHSESIALREGDGLKISFPGVPNLNTTQIVRRDGNITLPLVGEVKAVGKTPAQLRDDLVKLYAGQIESKEITVELASSAFPIFVTGAVLRPGKVMSDHPMTVLEAIMEAGGPDYMKANLKSVRILRQDGSHIKNYDLNVQQVMNGIDAPLFYMQAGDIIYVREKFSWF
jgi:polysaccharide export outer membrane protein